MFTVRKIFKIEMAHALSSSYSEECQCIHGHSYKVEVIILSLSLNQDGMVIDFKRLKEICNPVINYFDHKCFLQSEVTDNEPPVYLPGVRYVDTNPTAENMAKHIYEQLIGPLNEEVKSLISLRVRVHETETGYAEYSAYNLR